jgi:hypothetical protein
MYRTFAAAALLTMSIGAPVQDAAAQDPVGGAILGGAAGAILGGAMGGGRGAAVGAIVGGATGVGCGCAGGRCCASEGRPRENPAGLESDGPLKLMSLAGRSRRQSRSRAARRPRLP